MEKSDVSTPSRNADVLDSSKGLALIAIERREVLNSADHSKKCIDYIEAYFAHKRISLEYDCNNATNEDMNKAMSVLTEAYMSLSYKEKTTVPEHPLF